MTTKENYKTKNIHLQSGMAIDMIIKTSLVRRTLDNVTCVMIAFSNFEKLFKSENNSNNTNTNSSSTYNTINVNTNNSNTESNSNLAEEKERYYSNQSKPTSSTSVDLLEKKLFKANNQLSQSEGKNNL